eukprot:7283426-Lingulodinium_polyedra.AAC.1
MATRPPVVWRTPCQMWLVGPEQHSEHCRGKKHRAAAAGKPRDRLSRLREAREAAARDAASQALL